MTDSNLGDDEKFYLVRAGEGVIGYDGAGAIDFDNSDLHVEMVEFGSFGVLRKNAVLLTNKTDHSISMRRGVKEFDFFYDDEFNVLLVAPSIFEEFHDFIEKSSLGMRRINCRFGAKSRSYYFGNLRHVACLEDCVWSMSSFRIVDRKLFDVNQTEVGQGEKSLDHEVAYVARGQIFGDLKDYYRRRPSLCMNIPEHLTLSFPFCDIVNIGVAQTLISSRLFDRLWGRARPKSRVLGITSSYPVVRVTFNSGDTGGM